MVSAKGKEPRGVVHAARGASHGLLVTSDKQRSLHAGLTLDSDVG